VPDDVLEREAVDDVLPDKIGKERGRGRIVVADIAQVDVGLPRRDAADARAVESRAARSV
jgi:hypothetical protein